MSHADPQASREEAESHLRWWILAALQLSRWSVLQPSSSDSNCVVAIPFVHQAAVLLTVYLAVWMQQ